MAERPHREGSGTSLSDHLDKLITYLNICKKKLETYECYWNWTEDKLTENVAKTMLNKMLVQLGKSDQLIVDIEPDDQDDYEDDEGEDESISIYAEDKLSFLKYISYTSAASFLYSYLEKYGSAKKLAGEVRSRIETLKNMGLGTSAKLVRLDRPTSDQLKAAIYIIDGLDVYIDIKSGDLPSSNRLGRLVLAPNELCDSSWGSVVQEFKMDFLSASQLFSDELLNATEEMMQLAPGSQDVYLNYCRIARADRRKTSTMAPPNDKEVQAAIEAFSLAPNSLQVISTVCLNMAEIVRSRGKNKEEWCPLKYGDEEYTSPEEMVQVIQQRARMMISETQKAFLQMSSIFDWVLPQKWRNLELTEQLLDHTDPDSPLVMHRRALLLIQKVKTLELCHSGHMESAELIDGMEKQAENLLRQAIDMPNNPNRKSLNMVEDLIRILLRHPAKNKEELGKLLNDQIEKIRHQKSKSKLYILRGAFSLMLEEVDDGLRDWVQAYHLDPEAQHFAYMQKASFRFGWPKKAQLEVTNIKQGLATVKKERFDREHLSALDRLKMVVYKLQAKSTSHSFPTAGPLPLGNQDPNWRMRSGNL